MRIAFVTPGFSADDTDWCIPVLQDLARALGSNNDVQVYATCYPPVDRRYVVKGVAVAAFGDGRPGRLAWLRRQRNAVRAIAEDHARLPFDVVHGFWADGGGFVGARLNRHSRVPLVVGVMAGELSHVPEVGYGKRRRPIAGRIARYGARSADLLLANSSWHAARVREANGRPEPVPLRLGIDPSRFRPDGASMDLAGDVPILCCGSLVPVKGHEQLLAALGIASKQVPGLHLHIVGEGLLGNELRASAAAAGIGKSVTFHGHVAHDRLAPFYRGARFCVSASWFESHGMVIVEAGACGTPTAGTGVGSLPEFCPPELLTRPGDVPGLADAIVRLARDTNLYDKAAAAASSAVADAYRLDHSVRSLEVLYAQAIAKVAGSR